MTIAEKEFIDHRLSEQEKTLRRLEDIATENSKVLHNGLKERMAKVEIEVEKLSDAVVKAIQDALTPPPWWQKFLLKTGGTFLIVFTFVGAMLLLAKALPVEVLATIIQTAAEIIK